MSWPRVFAEAQQASRCGWVGSEIHRRAFLHAERAHARAARRMGSATASQQEAVKVHSCFLLLVLCVSCGLSPLSVLTHYTQKA